MVQQIMHRKLNLFEHICRMMDNRLVKEVTFGIKFTHSTGRRRIAARGGWW